MSVRIGSFPFVDLPRFRAEEEVLSLIPEDVARRFLVFPLFRLEERLYVAAADPDDLLAHDYLRQLTGLGIVPVESHRPDLEAAINRHFLTREKSAQVMGKFVESGPRVAEMEEIDLRVEDLEAPAIKLVNHLFSQAVNLGASDIHLDRFPDHAGLRYRVDGVLHEFPAPPLHLYRAVVSRIKILANLDVAERRLPQDGRATFRSGDREYDLRISIIPNLHGECVVVRILDTHGMGLELEALGFSPEMLERYRRLVQRPHGILLVTGPTGSGKTTTLYATLKQIRTPRKKIVTLEDPVEYQLDGITQFQVRSDIGFDFARGLRSILRHDPDILMLGEIRDLESAEIAVRASLTGHLVFSTLHTNDAPSALMRLVDMGIPGFLVSASLNGVLAQRLLRRLCPECKQAASPGREELSFLGLQRLPDSATLYRPGGCSSCGQLGYRGRVGIFELLEVTPAMRQLSRDALDPESLGAATGKTGYVSLRESALEKLFSGLTSLEEVSTLAAVE